MVIFPFKMVDVFPIWSYLAVISPLFSGINFPCRDHPLVDAEAMARLDDLHLPLHVIFQFANCDKWPEGNQYYGWLRNPAPVDRWFIHDYPINYIYIYIIYIFIHIYRLLTIVLVVYWISQPSSPVGTRLCQPRDPKFGKTLEGVQLICQWLVWH